MKRLLCAAVIGWVSLQPSLSRAQCGNGACVHVGASQTVDGNESSLLDTLLSSLSTVPIDLDTNDYQALSNAHLSLDQLTAALQANGVASTQAGALSAQSTLSTLFDSMADALQTSNPTAAAAAMKLKQQTQGLTQTISLADLVNADARPEVWSATDLNTLDLTSGLTELYNLQRVSTANKISISANALGLGAPLANLELTFFTLSAPSYGCGPIGTTFKSSALRLKVHATLTGNQPIGLNVDGLLSASIQLSTLDLIINVGQAQGTLTAVNAITPAVTLQVTPGVTDIYLGTLPDAVFQSRSASTDIASSLQYATLANVSVSVLALVSHSATVDAKGSVATGAATPATLQFSGSFPQTQTATFGSTTLTMAITNLIANLDVRINAFDPGFVLGGVIQSALQSAVTTLLHTTNSALGPLLNPLASNVVDPILGYLGIRWASTDTTVDKAYHIPTGTPCVDDLYCTVGATCTVDDTCGVPMDCSDELNCTTDSCDEANDRCSHVVNAGCAIDNTCYDADQNEPGNTCRSCQPNTSKTSWSNKGGSLSCNDGKWCTSNDTCTSGVCTGTALSCTDSQTCATIPGWCLIDNVCRSNNSNEPGNSCHYCDPNSPSAWQTRPQGTSCDDGQFCTQGETCNASGVCSGGGPRSCSDGLGCTTDDCDETNHCHSSFNGVGCQIDNACWMVGDTDPRNSCHICAMGSPMAWVNKPMGASCQDGLFCTQNDQCNASGACVAGAQLSCPDIYSCAMESCNETAHACGFTVNSGCVVDGACRTNLAPNPNNPCQYCNSALSKTSWSNYPQLTPCNDNKYCVVNESCDGNGACVGQALPCDDHKACTTDTCTEGAHGCVSTMTGCNIDNGCQARDTPSPNDPCKSCQPDVSISAWTPKANGASCDDGKYCTVGETCDTNGQCNGEPRSCADALSCTADSCNEDADTCAHTPTTGCVINNKCVADGEIDQTNACQVCNASKSTSLWSVQPIQHCLAQIPDGDPDDDGNTNDDECPLGLQSCPDTDGDGDPDNIDVDDDGDGIRTRFELAGRLTLDHDGDGRPDHLDNDDDGDGVLTRTESPDPNGDGDPADARNTDHDAFPDYLDTDDDGDGILTVDERALQAIYGDDLDLDGIPDYLDDDDDGDGILTLKERADVELLGISADIDGDGVVNWRDPDSDGDGKDDRTENTSEGQGDANHDGVPDYLQQPSAGSDAGPAADSGSGSGADAAVEEPDAGERDASEPDAARGGTGGQAGAAGARSGGVRGGGGGCSVQAVAVDVPTHSAWGWFSLLVVGTGAWRRRRKAA